MYCPIFTSPSPSVFLLQNLFLKFFGLLKIRLPAWLSVLSLLSPAFSHCWCYFRMMPCFTKFIENCSLVNNFMCCCVQICEFGVVRSVCCVLKFCWHIGFGITYFCTSSLASIPLFPPHSTSSAGLYVLQSTLLCIFHVLSLMLFHHCACLLTIFCGWIIFWLNF